jgi:hypothetical protein
MILVGIVLKIQHIPRWLGLFSAVIAISLGGVANLCACELSNSRQITDLLMNKDFVAAGNHLQRWQQHEARSADPGFYRAMLMVAQANDLGGERRERLSQQALDKLLKWVAGSVDSKHKPASVLTMGMARAFIARIYLDQERWFKAYRYGRAARDELRALIKREPDSADAYLILGLYEFYTGSVPAGLRWLMALIDLSGDREKGLRYLEQAVVRAPVAAPEAARVLVYELPLKAPQVCRYMPLLKDLRDRYPKSHAFILRLQRVYRICGYPLRALEENQQVRKESPSNQPLRRKLDWEALHIYRDLGDLDGIESLSSRFGRSSLLWLTAKAEALDVLGEYRQARAIYRQIGKGKNSEQYFSVAATPARYKAPPRSTNMKQFLIREACVDGK